MGGRRLATARVAVSALLELHLRGRQGVWVAADRPGPAGWMAPIGSYAPQNSPSRCVGWGAGRLIHVVHEQTDTRLADRGVCRIIRVGDAKYSPHPRQSARHERQTRNRSPTPTQLTHPSKMQFYAANHTSAARQRITDMTRPPGGELLRPTPSYQAWTTPTRTPSTPSPGRCATACSPRPAATPATATCKSASARSSTARPACSTTRPARGSRRASPNAPSGSGRSSRCWATRPSTR